MFPLTAILAIGIKLQAILTMMAVEITKRYIVVQGIPLVQGSDTYFWFSKPRLIPHLLHFTLFQYEFKSESCFRDDPRFELFKITTAHKMQELNDRVDALEGRIKMYQEEVQGVSGIAESRKIEIEETSLKLQ
ncbi:hypothetical protein RND81_04G103300 [Saponaria officinalis]|uniref:Uncharacterized protein n=1 Tax=Saponaria officinalis TaxID=3572 RepID=A0AAW1LJU5_SAPOF